MPINKIGFSSAILSYEAPEQQKKRKAVPKKKLNTFFLTLKVK
jgi:hypothetical protein